MYGFATVYTWKERDEMDRHSDVDIGTITTGRIGIWHTPLLGHQDRSLHARTRCTYILRMILVLNEHASLRVFDLHHPSHNFRGSIRRRQSALS
jgi:hypothetical protein